MTLAEYSWEKPWSDDDDNRLKILVIENQILNFETLA